MKGKKLLFSVVCFIIAASCAYSWERPKLTRNKDEKLFSYNDFKCKLTSGPIVLCPDSKGATVLFTSDCDSLGWVEYRDAAPQHPFYREERTNAFGSPLGRKLIGTTHTIRVDNDGKPFEFRPLIKKVVFLEGYRGVYGFSDGFMRIPYKMPPPLFNKFLDENKKSVNFIALGNLDGKGKRVGDFFAGQKKKYMSSVDFVIFNGNFSDGNSNRKAFVKNFLQPATDAVPATPLFFVRGANELSGYLRETFSQTFPTYSGKTYYSFRQGAALIIVLDSFDTGKKESGYSPFDDSFVLHEAMWLKELVSSEAYKNAPRKIVFFNGNLESKSKPLAKFAKSCLSQLGDVDLVVSSGDKISLTPSADGKAASMLTLPPFETAKFNVSADSIRADFENLSGKSTIDSIVVPLANSGCAVAK